MTIASPAEFTAAASGPISVPGPETVIGLLQVPVGVDRMAARTTGVALLFSQTASARPPEATLKYTWPTLVSLPDRTTGDDQVLLLMEPLTANACDEEKPMNS